MWTRGAFTLNTMSHDKSNELKAASECGDLEAVRRLLNDDVDVNAVDSVSVR